MSIYEICAYFQAHAVVGHHFQFFDIVVGLAGHYGMHTAGVVADHAADRASVMRRGIGSEREMEFFGGVAQVIKHDSGLHAGDTSCGIDLENLCHVLGEVEHDRDVAALTGERSTTAAAKYGCVKFATERDRSENIVSVAGQNDADRDLTIVGGIGRVDRPAARIKSNFPEDLAAQSFREPEGVG
jgi:hypothetical protein